MPGAFAHITAVNIATETRSLKNLEMPNKAKLMLSQNRHFLELGSVSPDYPYLAIGNHEQNRWADLMHYEKTGDLIKIFAEYCRDHADQERKRTFPWLCGFVSHVIADITIHPVVERKVGPYEQNQAKHRTCEMNQDAYIWRRLGLGEIGLADRVEINIGHCVTESGAFDDAVTEIWANGLRQIHSAYSAAEPPDMLGWHKGFQLIVNHAEEGYRFFPWARHVAAGAGLLYPKPSEIDAQYINNLETPIGPMHYGAIFDLAVSNIRKYIDVIGNYVFSDGSLDAFRNWNLDNGKDESGELTAWQ